MDTEDGVVAFVKVSLGTRLDVRESVRCWQLNPAPVSRNGFQTKFRTRNVWKTSTRICYTAV